jgi:exosortase/archaeosortase family protein
MKQPDIRDLVIRYALIVLIGLGNLYIFYWALTPLTINVIASILGIFTNVLIIGNQIFTGYGTLELIPSCVAGAAYFLLFALVLSTARLTLKKRVMILLSTGVMFFILNIARIILLFLISNTVYFETLHWLSWNIFSTILIIAIWLLNVWLFKVKTVPVYTDFEELVKLMKEPGGFIEQ